MNIITKVAFDKAVLTVRRGKQAMVFVHSRKDTVKTARALIELATEEGEGLMRLLSPLFGDDVEDSSGAAAAGGGGSGVKSEGRLSLSESQWSAMQREISKSRNADLQVGGTVVGTLAWVCHGTRCALCLTFRNSFRKALASTTPAVSY